MDHQDWYAQCLPDRPTLLLKVRLNEYCLGHEILLHRLSNPLVGASGEARLPSVGDVMTAALICSHTFEDARRWLHSRFFGLLLRLWKWRLAFPRGHQRVDWLSEARVFLDYRSRAFWRPEEAEHLKRRQLESPWVFRMLVILMSEFHMSESQALNFPLARAYLYYAAHGEMQGVIDLIGERLEELIRLVEAQDLAGPSGRAPGGAKP